MGLIINGNWDSLSSPIPLRPILNSPQEILRRRGIKIIQENVPLTATGAVNLNVFKVTGTVRVLDQIAIISEATAITDMTDVYADVWDGTNSVELTKSPGINLSGSPVGTTFSKEEISSEVYSLAKSDQCRIIENIARTETSPFLVIQKNGTPTYIRFNYTAGAALDIKLNIYFIWEPVNGGNLEIA